MGYSDEFPLLGAYGLYASNIEADGNCLFHALSDQLYGHPREHSAIRARVIAYMRENADFFKQFLDVHPGGGLRRNPKRKNAGAYSAPPVFTPPTPEEIDRVFESHLERMAKGGTYGDNMEIQAFSSAFDVGIKIYLRDYAYFIGDGGRTTLHIAYHTWEHYSSVRNINGPHSGLPNVVEKVLSPEEEQRQKRTAAEATIVQPWMINCVTQSLPFLTDKATIKRMLEETKGNVNAAVDKLLEEEERGSISSTQESSSVERDADSDDDAVYGPNKRRERHLNRAVDAAARRRLSPKSRLIERQQNRLEQLKRQELALASSSQESLASVDSQDNEKFTVPHIKLETSKSSDGDDDDWRPISENDDSAISAPSTPPPPIKPIRLKINPPKELPPDEGKLAGTGKTVQRQVGPQPRRKATARERKDIKKQAQKAARKERALAEAAGNNASNGVNVSIRSKDHSAGVGVEPALRTLYI